MSTNVPMSTNSHVPMSTHGNNKFLLEIKESLLIKLIKPELNKNISSAPLYLFDTV